MLCESIFTLMNRNLYKFAEISDDTISNMYDAFYLYNNGWDHDEHAAQRLLNKKPESHSWKDLPTDYLNDDDLYSLGLDYYSKYNKADRWKDNLDYFKLVKSTALKDKDDKRLQLASRALKEINTKRKMDMIMHNLLKNIDKKNEHKYNWVDSLKRRLTGQQDDPLYNYEKTKALLEFNKPSLESVNQAYLDLNKMKHNIDKSDLSHYYVDQVKLLRRLGLKTEKD